MLDGKILAAVLATLTAIGVSTSGGSLEDQKLKTSPGDIDLDVQGLVENPVKKTIDMFTTTPEPSNEVRATLKAENLWKETVRAEGARLEISGLRKIGYSGSTVKSNEKIMVYDFSGKVEPGNKTKASGTASGILTSGVNISASSAVRTSVSTEKIRLKGIEETSVALSEVSGSINSANYSTDFDTSRTLSIDSFSGDMTIYPPNKTVIIDGKVNQLSAGPLQFGN